MGEDSLPNAIRDYVDDHKESRADIVDAFIDGFAYILEYMLKPGEAFTTLHPEAKTETCT